MNTPQDGGQGQGMTLRDYFAAAALQAIISKHPAGTHHVWEDAGELDFARGAYAYSDAMLDARKEQSEP